MSSILHCKKNTIFFINKIFITNFLEFPPFLIFLSLSLTLSHFLPCQTAFEDDNSEDEWVNPHYPSRGRLLDKGSKGFFRVSHVFNAAIYCHLVSRSNTRFKSLRCTLNNLYLAIF